MLLLWRRSWCCHWMTRPEFLPMQVQTCVPDHVARSVPRPRHRNMPGAVGERRREGDEAHQIPCAGAGKRVPMIHDALAGREAGRAIIPLGPGGGGERGDQLAYGQGLATAALGAVLAASGHRALPRCVHDSGGGRRVAVGPSATYTVGSRRRRRTAAGRGAREGSASPATTSAGRWYPPVEMARRARSVPPHGSRSRLVGREYHILSSVHKKPLAPAPPRHEGQRDLPDFQQSEYRAWHTPSGTIVSGRIAFASRLRRPRRAQPARRGP